MNDFKSLLFLSLGFFDCDEVVRGFDDDLDEELFDDDISDEDELDLSATGSSLIVFIFLGFLP